MRIILRKKITINNVVWGHLFNRFESHIIPLNPIVIYKFFFKFLEII
jgi:hypothetical protein